MRVVGQYKDTDIRLTDLHMSKTYGGWLTDPSGKRLEEANWEMINVGIPKRVEKMWGTNTALHVMDIDHKNRLPEVEVMACLKCHPGSQSRSWQEEWRTDRQTNRAENSGRNHLQGPLHQR